MMIRKLNPFDLFPQTNKQKEREKEREREKKKTVVVVYVVVVKGRRCFYLSR